MRKVNFLNLNRINGTNQIISITEKELENISGGVAPVGLLITHNEWDKNQEKRPSL